MPSIKTLPARAKAAEDGGEGIVEALVATYDVDSSGDRIVPGAFTKSLGEWQESGNPIPFIWSHMHNDLDAYIGDVLEAKETDEGLWVRAQLDLEDEKAAKAFRLIKGGRVRNYSFAYEVLDADEDEDGDGERALKEIRLFEVGPTLIGMNQNTRTLVAKASPDTSRPSGEEKAGRVLSAKNEADLRTALDLIKGVLSQLGEASNTSQAKTSDTGPATDKEPPVTGATAKEPSRGTPVTTLAAHLNLLRLKGDQ
jgi:HK97 family phage prohead protease